MSDAQTFSFAGANLAAARTLVACGRPARAAARLAAVLGADRLPRGMAVEAHRLAAAAHHDLGQYGKARKHLRSALVFAPDDAGLHHALGLAFEQDPYGSDERAARRFAKAVVFAPESAAYRAALGRALVRVNRVNAGLKELRLAAKLAPADGAVLEVVVEGLRDADRPRLAYKLVARARFLAPTDAGVKRLWDRAKFDVARAGQVRAARPAGGRAVLPFVRVFGARTAVAGVPGVIRRDAASPVGPHFGRRQAHRAGPG